MLQLITEGLSRTPRLRFSSVLSRDMCLSASKLRLNCHFFYRLEFAGFLPGSPPSILQVPRLLNLNEITQLTLLGLHIPN